MFEKTIFTIDAHTAGEATRVILGGILNIPGKTMMEKREYFKKNYDDIRKLLMLEPRGHLNMFGAVVTAPVNSDSHFGVIFMDPHEYDLMCGHGSIGVVTIILETGMIKATEPITTLVFDTPAGTVRARARIHNGSVESVTLRNVPSFLYKSIKIELPKIGELPVAIAYGGLFYAIVSAKDLGVKVEPKNCSELIDIGIKVIEAVNLKTKVKHPEQPHIHELFAQIVDDPKHPEAHAKNFVVTKGGQSDRSPCGTGTSARMATLYANGKLGLNEEFVNESIIGTIFRGKLSSKTKVGEYDAVVPQITGSAYITGICTFVSNPNDPLKSGFLLI